MSIVVTGALTIVDVSDGPSLSVASSAAAFTYVDNVPTPSTQTIALTLVRQNVSDSATWSASNGAVLSTDKGRLKVSSFSLGILELGVGDTCYVDLSAIGSLDQIFITAVAGTQSASFCITKQHRSTADSGATRNVFRGSYATAGSVWSNTDALAAVVAAGGVSERNGDVLTLYNNNTSYSETRTYNGSTWTPMTAFFGGDVIVEGTLGVSKLVVGDRSNLVHDPLFNEINTWSPGGGAVLTVSSGNMASWGQDKVVSISGAATSYSSMGSKPFAVEPGDRILYSAVASLVTGAQINLSAYMSFQTSVDGITFTQVAVKGLAVTDGATPVEVSSSYLIPSGIRFARLRLLKSGAGSVTEVKFARPRVRFMVGSSLIVDGALSVAGMSAFGGELKSNGAVPYIAGVQGWRIDNDGAAEFNSLVVRTANIEDEGVNLFRYFYDSRQFNVTSASTWTTIGTLKFPRAGYPTGFDVSTGFDGYGNGSLVLGLFRGSTQIASSGQFTIGGRMAQCAFTCVDTDEGVGSTTYYVKAKKADSATSAGFNANLRILRTYFAANQFKR